MEACLKATYPVIIIQARLSFVFSLFYIVYLFSCLFARSCTTKKRTKKILFFSLLYLVVQERSNMCVYASACCRVSINFVRCCIDNARW